MWMIDETNCVRKQHPDGRPGGLVKCFGDDVQGAKNYMETLHANVKESATSPVVDFSMNIVKASYDKSDNSPRHWRAVDSDTDKDLYDEQMSPELYQDFISRINEDTPVPEAFKSVICEESWCGGMPYLSIAHYKAGEQAKNVPGKVEAIYIDGNKLKSKGILDDTPLGRQVFDSLCDDLYRKKSGDTEHLPVRISIGFLDLQHKHVAQQGGQEYIFTRSTIGQICPLCEQGIGGKIYLKGQLVHLALTRVPVNTRTEMIAEKSMTEIIQTKKDDAKSIIKELADELDERSLADGTLVVRAEGVENGTMPIPDPMYKECYDPNLDKYNQECIDKIMSAHMVSMRKDVGAPVKSTVDKALLDAVSVSIANLYKSQGITPALEDNMKVEKTQLGGESVLEKKFNYEGIDGDPGNNITAAPIPVKAKVEVEMEDEKDEEKEEKSTVDQAYELLKSRLGKGATVEEMNEAFSQLAAEVEKSYVPKAPAVDLSNLASIVEAAVMKAVTPLNSKIATLEATLNNTVSKSRNEIPASRSLKLRPEDFMQKAVTNAPQRKLSQIEMLARKSTGAYVPEQ